MAGQKPKLEYARPNAPQKNLKVEFAKGFVLAASGSVGLFASASWIWSFFHHDKHGFYCLIEAAVCAAFALLAFWLMVSRQ